ncbi:diguanylate cyclase [Blastococcus goldschmidtiae]|uniref:Diguanylate cyclase n=1 Tax=Blastococcus goldschmidtiae TaxID=3075546 RepID=A0ABU2KC90_9ACTN|nr:diguanylate cyclase [Blastococcus sp. DSM 46792]MDT0277810.1 diguanylate cyclase [Blastococcus sp. DSM 46792]
MTPQQWALLFACAAVVAVVTAVLAWRRRGRTPAATALALTMVGVACWSAADAVVYSVEAQVVRLVYPAVLLASVGLVVVSSYSLARSVSTPSWRLSRRAGVLLAIEPVVLVVVAAVPASRDLVLSGVGLDGSSTGQQMMGPLFLAHTAYSYLLVGLGYAYLVRRVWSAAGVFRRQAGVLLASGALSTVGNVVAVAGQADGSGIDVTPLFFLVSGLVSCWTIFRLGLLRLVPVAREQVVDTVPDAVLVVDPLDVLIDLNPAASRLLCRLRPELHGVDVVGRPLSYVAGPRAVATLQQVQRADGHRLAEVAPDFWIDVRDTAVSDTRGRPLGRILVVRDVSEQQARQAAVEELNRQLAEQVQVIDRLRAELAEEAVRDPLTGLHNRRHLDRVLAGDLDAGTRDDGQAVLVLDIDHFKVVNDRFGHAAGDLVLSAVARLLQAAVRDGDTAVRLGGEEFLVLLPGADRDQALRRAEQIRRDVAAAIHSIDGEQIRVTISAGVAVGPHDGASAAALLEAADQALYRAKAAGRDCVMAAAAGARDAATADEAPEPVAAG